MKLNKMKVINYIKIALAILTSFPIFTLGTILVIIGFIFIAIAEKIANLIKLD